MALAPLWCDCALAAEPRVILLRGLFGSVFSTGLDSLAGKLRAKGIHAKVAGHSYWATAAAAILRERATGELRPLVLIGHSQGGNNVIEAARWLGTHKVPVDLLVTLDPVTPGRIPANVVRAINYYQSNGWGSPIVPGRGFYGKLSNVDLRDDWSIFHITIDKSDRIHAAISREIAALPRPEDRGQAVALSGDQPAGGAHERSSEAKLPERAQHVAEAAGMVEKQPGSTSPSPVQQGSSEGRASVSQADPSTTKITPKGADENAAPYELVWVVTPEERPTARDRHYERTPDASPVQQHGRGNLSPIQQGSSSEHRASVSDTSPRTTKGIPRSLDDGTVEIVAQVEASATDRPWSVQLVAEQSESQARVSYERIQNAHRAILGGLQPEITKVDLEGKGTYYRVRIGTKTQDAANKLCSSLQAVGRGCWVQRS